MYMQIHGYVCMAAVVVTDTLDWKLHGFDLTSEHALTGGLIESVKVYLVVPSYSE